MQRKVFEFLLRITLRVLRSPKAFILKTMYTHSTLVNSTSTETDFIFWVLNGDGILKCYPLLKYESCSMCYVYLYYLKRNRLKWSKLTFIFSVVGNKYVQSTLAECVTVG